MKLTTILIILSLNTTIFAQNINFNIQVNVPQQIDPDIYRLQTDPNIFINLFSDADQPYQAIFEVTAEEMDLGEVFRATSHPMDIPNGMWNEQIDNTTFMNEAEPNLSGMTSFAQLDFNPELETQLMQFGLLPDGIYTICVFAYFFQDGQLLAQACNNTTVFLPEPPVQISPVACEEAAFENVLFNWTPVQWNGPVNYRVSIFQVLPGQTVNDALVNIPFAVDEVFNQTTYIYSSANLPLEPGQYAWTVEAFDDVGAVFTNPAFNEPECFTLAPPYVLPDTIFTTSIQPGGKPPVPFLIPDDEVEQWPCMPYMKVKSDPSLDGGIVMPFHQGFTIARHDFIALRAFARDFDTAIYGCQPLDKCEDSASEYEEPLPGMYTMLWSIESGGGSFVHIGCLPEKITEADGENVIFKPPYVKPDTTIEVKIKLIITDPAGGSAKDPTVIKTATLSISRQKTGGWQYGVKMTGDPYAVPEQPPKKTIVEGTCKSFGLEKLAGNSLVAPTVQLPSTPDNDKLVTYEWMSLTAAPMPDNDVYKVSCYGEKCESGSVPFTLPDQVDFNWKVVSGPGSFINGGVSVSSDYGKRVTLQANGPGTIVIEVKAYNPSHIAGDPESPATRVTILSFKPGVEILPVAESWLPEYRKELKLCGKFRIKEGEFWTAGLAHMCNIVEFELFDVSNEPGIATNYDPPLWKLEDNPDMFFDELKNADYELTDPINGKPNYYGKATTKKMAVGPNCIEPIVWSEDWGGWAKARIKTGTGGWEVVGDPASVPRDDNENHIADGARHWDRAASSNEDTDNFPRGDGQRGDGYTAYEEYRGFYYVSRSHPSNMLDDDIAHIRTNLRRKDIFILDPSRLGIGYFGATNLTIHMINVYQHNGRRLINWKSRTHKAQNQYCLFLTRIFNPKGPRGQSVGGPGVPRAVNRVEINMGHPDMIHAAIKNRVIAHELSHSVSVRHHGDFRGFQKRCILSRSGKCVNSRVLTRIGGLYSGNTGCYMRYLTRNYACPNAAGTFVGCDWGSILTWTCSSNGMLYGFVRDWIVGTGICRSSAGTGINAPGSPGCAGGATRGNCYGQIRLK